VIVVREGGDFWYFLHPSFKSAKRCLYTLDIDDDDDDGGRNFSVSELCNTKRKLT